MGVTFHATMNCGVIHVILKTITRTRTLKGGGFGLTEGQIYICLFYFIQFGRSMEKTCTLTLFKGIVGSPLP